MEISGTVKRLSEPQTFGSGFTKREMVVLTQEQYPQPISIEFTQDKVSLLDQIQEGDMVKVAINLRGREWQAPDGTVKFFNSITGWRIEKGGSTSDEPVAVSKQDEKPKPNNDNPFADEKEDDLPF